MSTSWYKLLAGRFITTRWPIVIAAWLILGIVLNLFAPRWSDIAADGDLSFLPSDVPSAVGLRELEKAFPGSTTRSSFVIVVANESQELQRGDRILSMDLLRRLHWIAANSAWHTLQQLGEDSNNSPSTNPEAAASQQTGADENQRMELLLDQVQANLDEVIELESQLATRLEQGDAGLTFPRTIGAYELRAKVNERLGDEKQVAIDLATAKLLAEQGAATKLELPLWTNSLGDVWSWRSPVVGSKLGADNEHARLISVPLATDFTAAANIDILEEVRELTSKLRSEHASLLSPDLKVEVSGSAAVGVDMLTAASSSVRKTEIVTIALVLIILAAVYRAPLLIAIPLISIGMSLWISTSVISLLARNPAAPDSWGLGVFTTTRIFVVVLLFGAGTDFCLFFLARNREALSSIQTTSRRKMYRIIASGWRGVHDALVASALTTIVGLALMWFSKFEKFQFSGPIIAISLGITLLICLTFTPALLSAFGRVAFWPYLSSRAATNHPNRTTGGAYWSWIAKAVVQHPTFALVGTCLILAGPAIYGVTCLGKVTYDFTEELSANAPSRQGSDLIEQFFATRESRPLTVLLTRDEPFTDTKEMREANHLLSQKLYTDGVQSVRSLTDPLGDYPPGKKMGLLSQDAWLRRFMTRVSQQRYSSSVTSLSNRVARFDVVLTDSPFSLAAGKTLDRLQDVLKEETESTNSQWKDSSVSFAGTTVGITDLRTITQADRQRIQLLVTCGVWLVLMLILRRVVLCSYLILTVLFSYFATLGITFATFNLIYGAEYTGLDWKVPIFLFVILVAVGQDYNVYLVTRIIEESKEYRLRRAVRRALQKTGGIITSCGLVMAGTFIAMASPAVWQWLGTMFPSLFESDFATLRGITELGFALSFGVMLDTLVIRSVLVPAFIVLWHSKKGKGNRPIPSPEFEAAS